MITATFLSCFLLVIFTTFSFTVFALSNVERDVETQLLLGSLSNVKRDVETRDLLGSLSNVERVVETRHLLGFSALSNVEREVETQDLLGFSALSNVEREVEIQALLGFKSGLEDPLGGLSSWKNSSRGAPCDWVGVTCHVENSTSKGGTRTTLAGVRSVSLTNLSLSGPLSNFSNLTRLQNLNLAGNLLTGKISGDFPASLRYLDLSSNLFSGEIPPNFSPNLRLINLSFNKLSGEIPASIGKLQKLEYLNLDSNSIYGTIPSALSNCSSLINFSAADNLIRGIIPTTLGFLPNLQELTLSNNKISGSVPFSLLSNTNKKSALRAVKLGYNALTGIGKANPGNIFSSELQVLDLHGNNISDVFPSYLTNISPLEYLDISNNSFSGNLPREIGNLVNLHELRVANNFLNGGLPVEILKCGSLEVLDLENNRFSGEIIDLGELRKMKTLSLGGNQFTGPLPLGLANLYELELLNLGNNNLSGPLPEQLMKLSNLSSLDLSNNRFLGGIPNDIGALKGLRDLNMSGCGFLGEVPISIGNLLKLTSLDLSKQNLSGELPFELFGLPNLQVVTLDNNKLSGAVPEGFSSLSNLRFLNLSSNSFTNEIPVTYGFLQSLSVLSLSRNNIVGTIPIEFGNCSSLEILEIRGNNLNGDIPSSISHLGDLQKLDLGENGLTGTIPKGISNCSSLVSLFLDSNNLSGPIPNTISKLSNLTKLDLSSNRLSGEIPSSLALIKSLTYLNLSTNNFEGEIPEALSSRFGDPSVFAMNRDLCGRPLSSNCKTREKANNKRMILLLAVAISGSIIVGFCCCGYLITFIYWQKKLRNGKNGEKKPSPRTSSGTESGDNRGPKLIMFNDKITYAETMEATRQFDEENVLSRGKYGLLFKATYIDGMVLAIRRLPDASVDVGTFRKEAEALGEIKHRNLTVLRGYFAGLPNVRLLIYDYMPNGNLATLLQEASHQDGHILNWPMRHLIALGIARGLAFLHSVTIFHGDVNPQNILFDADFEAHLSDFGLEKLTMVNVEPSSSSTVIGTVGYVAPEISLTGQLTKETDVYSFGIVLLEILTGRKPIMFAEDENIVKWVKKQLQSGNVGELLEPGLLDLDPESSEWEEFLLGVKVGLLCTSTDPLERPSMTDVVFMLEGCRVGADIPSSADPTTLPSPM